MAFLTKSYIRQGRRCSDYLSLQEEIRGQNGFSFLRITDYIFGTERAIWTDSHVPACPVMVFINSKSGGHLGGELLMTYRALLNKNQVVDLRENAPDKVLHQLYVNLERHKKSGDKMSFEIQKRLRLIVAGGDGTVNWLLGVVSDLKLAQSPPVATEGAFDPIAPLALPNSLHVFHRLSSTDTMNMEGRHTCRGGFWNYFSMGTGVPFDKTDFGL
ncbi:hypothetical protein RJ640_013442 [Escallonia rubra]|uniref:DAGKc domain-containing protein n=1 Tax=Escallonia rubra TaxID=112253 RepID=A0AA88R600_9ASTE|nr:hypothetical protein RJ640_013442 [Escallonia rubra]